MQQIRDRNIFIYLFFFELSFKQIHRFFCNHIKILLNSSDCRIYQIWYMRNFPCYKRHLFRNFDLAEFQRIPNPQTCGFSVGNYACNSFFIEIKNGTVIINDFLRNNNTTVLQIMFFYNLFKCSYPPFPGKGRGTVSYICNIFVSVFKETVKW